MNDKIQKLIKKLAKECQKEDVALSLAAIDLEGEMAISQVGKGTIVAIAAHSQYTLTKKTGTIRLWLSKTSFIKGDVRYCNRNYD